MWTKQSQKFNDVSPHILRRHVLESKGRVNEVEAMFIEQREIIRTIQMIPASIRVAVVLVSQLDHGGGDVHAMDFIEVLGKALG
jgi:hypothetical protein